MNQTESSEDRDQTVQWCAVVDTTARRVVHIHQFVPADESGVLAPEELARQALENTPSEHDRARIEVVHPDPDTGLEPRTHYGVDERGRLVARPATQRRQRPSSPSGK